MNGSPTAGSRSDPAVLDPATHAHGRWCLEVTQSLGLLPGQGSDSGSGGGGGSDTSASAGIRIGGRSGGTAGQPENTRRLPPLYVGVSLGGAMLLELACVVAPEAVGGAALVVPGGLLPGGCPVTARRQFYVCCLAGGGCLSVLWCCL